MKFLAPLLLLALPAISLAAPPMNMDPAMMQKMMNMDPAKMQTVMMEIQRCMENIDMKEMEVLKTRGEAMEREVKSLCKNGQRDAAMKKAMSYSKEIMTAPSLTQVKKCSENVRNLMPNMVDIEKYANDNYKDKHVCDSL